MSILEIERATGAGGVKEDIRERISVRTTGLCKHCGTMHGHGLISKFCGTPLFAYAGESWLNTWPWTAWVEAPPNAIHWSTR